MAGGASQDDEEMISGINVTPLVDVVLVLLIILMVSANQIAQNTQIEVDLPEADTGNPQEREEQKTLYVSITPDNTLYLDGEETTEGRLRGQIREASEAAEEVRAVIQADGAVQHRQVVRVIDLLRQEDVFKFAINVRPSDLAEE